MRRLTILFAMLLAVNLARAGDFEDQDVLDDQQDFDFYGLEKTKVALINYHGQNSLRLNYKFPVFTFSQLDYSLHLYNFAFDESYIWSEVEYEWHKLAVNYKVLHNFPHKWDALNGRRVSHFKLGYALTERFKMAIISQRIGRTSSAVFCLDWQLPFYPATLECDFFTLLKPSGQPAIFLSLNQDLMGLVNLLLGNSFKKHQRLLDRFLNRSARLVKRQTIFCHHFQPKHFFIQF